MGIPVKQKHPKWPEADEHLFSQWLPKSKTEQYRNCLHPDCKYYEVRDVPK